MAILFIVLSNLTVIGLVYFMWRNEAVYKMRNRVNNACYNYETYCLNLCATNGNWELLNRAYIITDEMLHRNGYGDMFFSFRPIKIENWYTPSECEIIKKFSTDD